MTLIRDPLSRLQSLYTYARSGGEHWFRHESNISRQLSDPTLTLDQSVLLFWTTFGQAYLIQSHEYMTMNINLGCVPIKMEAFRTNFSEPVVQILRVFGVREGAMGQLLTRVADADLGGKTEAQRRRDAHVTGNKFSAGLVVDVRQALLHLEGGAAAVLMEQQRRELGY